MPHRFRFILALFLLAPFACTDRPAETWAGTITDSAGVTLVDNPEQGLWPAQSPWSFVEEFRVGGMDAPVESQFGMVVGLDLDDAGNLYVLDMQAAQVSVFGPDGTWMRAFGRPGGGPGELSAQTTGVFIVGDELWVADLGNQRVTRWALDGAERPAIPLCRSARESPCDGTDWATTASWPSCAHSRAPACRATPSATRS